LAFLLSLLNARPAWNAAANRPLFPDSAGHFVLMTYASNDVQVRSVRALIKSVRERGGRYAGCGICVVLGDPERTPGEALKGANVELLPLATGRAFLDYPLAIKAFAAAEVEKLVKGEAGTLAWLDPGALVLNSLDALDLEGKHDAALRPVSLVNNIGLPPGAEPDAYWAPIYEANRLDYPAVPTLRTIVDETDIQPYFNCEVYSVDPALGMCAEWASQLAKLLKDGEYQRAACATFTRKLFLHQAVLSGVVASRVKQARLKPLPITSGYPFNQHARLSLSKRVAALNDLSVIIFDEAWERDSAWMDRIPVREPLKSWLLETYREFLSRAGRVR
jgi:hypothetical protein